MSEEQAAAAQRQEAMPHTELVNILEAVLLVSDVPLSVARLQNLFPAAAQPTREEISTALERLAEACAGRPVALRRIGNGYRFQTRERYAPWLRKLQETRPPRFSRALLETLAIIAYRQPVTRGDIEEIRGVSVSSDIMQRLLERQWIRQVGVRDVPGRPALFGTTREFLAYFNLGSLRELPELMPQRDLAEIAGDLRLELPGGEVEDSETAEPAEPPGGDAAPEKGGQTAVIPDAGAETEDPELRPAIPPEGG